MAKVRILFVCMGNICRSPLAEGIFLHKAGGRGVADRFEVDSAGTGGWHVGERPDSRAREIAARHDIILRGRARQVTAADFTRFDHLVCMDRYNREHLVRLGAPPQKLRLLLESDPGAAIQEVPDPYYDGGFEAVFGLIASACDALIDELIGENGRRR